MGACYMVGSVIKKAAWIGFLVWLLSDMLATEIFGILKKLDLPRGMTISLLVVSAPPDMKNFETQYLVRVEPG